MRTDADGGGAGRGTPWRLLGWGGAGLILLLPLVGMQVSDEVAWTASDFAFAAALLGAAGLGVELAVRMGGWTYRAAAGTALAAAFLLVWINGAVGIVGSEREDANSLYGLVPAVALLGAALARFRPAGTAWTMAGAAATQVLVPAGVGIFGLAPTALVLSPQVIGLTGGFVFMWLLSAWLFRRAAG